MRVEKRYITISLAGLVLAGISAFLLFGALSSGQSLPLEKIKLPPGFEISIYAGNVPDARSMTLSPQGTLFVGTRSEGRCMPLWTGTGITKLMRSSRSPAG